MLHMHVQHYLRVHLFYSNTFFRNELQIVFSSVTHLKSAYDLLFIAIS